jgi:hypothetical protein
MPLAQPSSSTQQIMKTLKWPSVFRACLFGLAGGFLISPVLHADLINTPSEYDGSANGGKGIDSPQPNLARSAMFSSSDFVPFHNAVLSALHDGTLGFTKVAEPSQTALDTSPYIVTITLDTSHTGSTTGYTVSAIHVFAGFNTGFVGQDYTLSYSVVGADSSAPFTPLGTYSYKPTTSNPGPATTETRLTSGRGAIASQVAALRFQFNKVPLGGLAGGNTGAYSEIEIFGTPTVSGPSDSLTYMFLLGGLGMLGATARIRAQPGNERFV